MFRRTRSQCARHATSSTCAASLPSTSRSRRPSRPVRPSSVRPFQPLHASDAERVPLRPALGVVSVPRAPASCHIRAFRARISVTSGGMPSRSRLMPPSWSYLFALLIVGTSAIASADSGRRISIELTTLRLMHEKGLITDAVMDSALRDLSDSVGDRALESTSLAIGKWSTTIYGVVQSDNVYDTTESFN